MIMSAFCETLFEDIGKKLKAVARFLVYLAVVAGAILILIGFIKFIKDIGDLESATVLGGSSFSSYERRGNSSFAGLMMMVYGIAGTFVSIISSMLMYGFGELVEKATGSSSGNTVEHYREGASSAVTPKRDTVESIIVSSRQPSAGEWKCSCGKVHPKYVSSCSCGKSRSEAN